MICDWQEPKALREQEIEALEHAGIEFMSYLALCIVERNSISRVTQDQVGLQAFSNLPISELLKGGAI